MKPGVLQKFLTNTDETGRFIVTSVRTGKRYFIEPIVDVLPALGLAAAA